MEKNTASHLSLIVCCIVAIVVGMVVSAFMLSRFMLRIQTTTEKSISVKGVAEKEVVSDLGAFRCGISVNNVNLADGYVDLAKKKEILHAKLLELGFKEEMFEDANIGYETVTRSVTVKENDQNVTKCVFDHYHFTYSMRIRTSEVNLIEQNYLRIYELAEKKLDIFAATPEYFISDLEQYKLELVDKASAAAAERAKIAVSQSGSRLGALIKARQGVIQINAPASDETSDYGVYDTSSVTKVIRLVMTLDFSLK